MTNEIRSHKDSHVWRKAMNLAEATYVLTTNLPKGEMYGLFPECEERQSRYHPTSQKGMLASPRGSTCVSFPLWQVRSLNSRRNSTCVLMATAGDLGKQVRALRRSLQARLETFWREPDEAEYDALD